MISRIHVIWSYRILLGRDPENEDAIIDKINRLKNIEMLREEILMCSEFSSKECQAVRNTISVNDEYLKWACNIILENQTGKIFKIDTTNLDILVKTLLQQRRIERQEQSPFNFKSSDKILLLGNCQTDLLARLLSHMSNCYVENIREDVLSDHNNHKAILQKVKSANVVITQSLSDYRFGDLQTKYLKKFIKKLIIIPSIYFSGLHPDLVYVGKMGNRYQSPIGDYHSAIGIAAFLEKVPPDQAIQLYRDLELFQSAGFHAEWQNSLNELKSRELLCDISISDYIENNIINKTLFYSSNHPAIELVVLLARRILMHLGFNIGWNSFWRDEMQLNVIYPIWNPICEYHKLTYRSPEIFFLPGGRELGLADYIGKAFKQYDQDLPIDAGLNPKVLELRGIIADRTLY
jgi:hypothetical protein